ncbi:hypothetical protein CKY47_08460 [Saccharothrix yanglingensis]|uniref:Uncharacterized protein n=1 Tax=Saccharothrix yanglingensis TaxID=659496 RepID=A0ABU0WY56_9PSEU|nr:hypothetical protein [Saccharothrix yanglingensis]
MVTSPGTESRGEPVYPVLCSGKVFFRPAGCFTASPREVADAPEPAEEPGARPRRRPPPRPPRYTARRRRP